MTRDLVNTPDGTMRVAGVLRPACALLTDLLMCLFLTVPFVHFAGIKDGPTAVIWIFGILGYSLLAFRGGVPSLGRWALGLRRYPYDLVEEYAGKGILYVHEDLPSRVYTRRTIAIVLLLGVLFGLALLMTRVLPNGSA